MKFRRDFSDLGFKFEKFHAKFKENLKANLSEIYAKFKQFFTLNLSKFKANLKANLSEICAKFKQIFTLNLSKFKAKFASNSQIKAAKFCVLKVAK